MLSTYTGNLPDLFLFHYRIAHHREISERRKEHGHATDKAPRKFDSAFVGIEELKLLKRWKRFLIYVTASVDNQRLEMNEALQKLEVANLVRRQVKVRDVVPQNIDKAIRKLVHVFECKRDFSVPNFVYECFITFA